MSISIDIGSMEWWDNELSCISNIYLPKCTRSTDSNIDDFFSVVPAVDSGWASFLHQWSLDVWLVMAYKYCFWFVNKTRRLGNSSRTYARRKCVTMPISTRAVLLPMFVSVFHRERIILFKDEFHFDVQAKVETFISFVGRKSRSVAYTKGKTDIYCFSNFASNISCG